MKPAWSLTDKDVERMIAVFARTLAIALAEELEKRKMYIKHIPFRAGTLDRMQGNDVTQPFGGILGSQDRGK